MFLDTWLPTQSDLESYPHIELTSRKHWNPHKIEFPQTKYYVQEEVEGWNFSKVTICFSGETPGDIDRPLDRYTRGDFISHIKENWRFPRDGDTRGDFRSHSEEVVIHAGMDDFHRRQYS